MSDSLHHTHPRRLSQRHCPLVADAVVPWYDAVCTVPLLDHPGGVCPQRLPGHPAAATRTRDGVLVTRRVPSGYARRWYRREMSSAETGRTRRERRDTAELLGQLSGDPDEVAELFDAFDQAHPHLTTGPARDVSWDVV